MMKTSAALIAILLTAATAAAQNARPDYSKDAVQRFVRSIDVYEPPVRYDRDSVTFTALGTTWNFNYLPALAMPLSGSQMRVTQEWPDPFALTRTIIATSPRAARRGREFSRELRRINRRLNATVKVTTE